MMKKKAIQSIFILFMSLSLVFSQAGAVFASGSSRESLEEYLEQLKADIQAIYQNLDDIYTSIEEVNELIDKNNVQIEELNVSLADQKKSMMKRIQYMYEAGADMDILLAILTSDSISDYLNKATYITQMVNYDREMLETYVNTIQALDDAQTELETRRTELMELRNSFEDAKYDSLDVIEEATERLAEYYLEEEEVQQVLEEFISEDDYSDISETEQLIYADEDEYENEEPDDNDTDDEEEAETREAEEPSEEETTTYEQDDPEPEYSGGNSSSGGYNIPISTHGYSEQDIYDMARVTYLEDGCVYPWGSYRSVYLCACVILNRANTWFGGSISGSIYAAGAYATAYKYTSWGGGELVINDVTWQAVDEALSNCDPNPYYQCNGDHLAGYGLTEYYRDPVSDEVFYLLD